MIMGVPYDAEVAYLESTGTQWIDTGYVLSASDRIVVQAYFKANDDVGSRVLLGVGNPKLWITSGLCRFNDENSASINKLKELEDWNSISIDKDYCTCNGTTVPMSNGTFRNNSLSLWLFGANDSTATKTNGRIASCKIQHSGTLVRDFIPVRVGSGANAVGYMYDRVSKRLFGNQGTGNFGIGEDVATPVMGIWMYKPTARDYVQDGLVAMWDGIENAGWGVHVDALPIKNGMTNLCNIVKPTVNYGGIDYDFGMNVVDMTVEPDGLSWNTTSAWAAWGHTFNTSQVSTTNAANILSQIFPVDGDNCQAMTLECVARLDTSGTATNSTIFAGYNERALYSSYSTSGKALVRWYVGGAQRYDYVQDPFATGTPQSIAIVQSATGGIVYINGTQAFTRNGACERFIMSMVSFLRKNSVDHAWTPSGKFYCMRASNRALTAAEIAHNYAIDQARFGIGLTQGGAA